MKRLGKFFAVCSCLLLCCAVLFGCAGRADLLGAPKGTPETLSRTERESEGLAALQESSEAFAARFAAAAYAAQAGRGNMAVSPLSVYMALAMEAEAAAGATREELLGALGTDAGTLRENFALLYRSAFFEGEKRKALLSNSIWLAQELPVQQACVDTLAEKYFCRSYHTDFAGDSEGANRAIRRFVKEQTNGLIDQNFELPAETYFAVINTLYLKDLWNGAGNDLPLTEETYAFAQADGSAAETQLMRGYYASGRPQAGEHFSYFFAETEGGNRLLFLLPDEGYSVQDVFTEENIAEAVAADDYGDYNEEKTVHYNTRCLFPRLYCDVQRGRVQPAARAFRRECAVRRQCLRPLRPVGQSERGRHPLCLHGHRPRDEAGSRPRRHRRGGSDGRRRRSDVGRADTDGRSVPRLRRRPRLRVRDRGRQRQHPLFGRSGNARLRAVLPKAETNEYSGAPRRTAGRLFFAHPPHFVASFCTL